MALDQTSPSRLERARLLFDSYAATLADAIGEDRRDVASVKERHETAKALHKALQSVIDIEADLDKRHPTAGAGELDLSAAREEIRRRLARRRG